MKNRKQLTVGDSVNVNCIEGFGGPAKVTAHRGGYQVKLDDGSQPPFWAHDGEIEELNEPAPAPYDSRPETYEHIQAVQRFVGKAIADLQRRQQEHDQSKLVSPERETFDEYTPKLKHTTYGSDEYKGFLAAMKPALDHHYAANSHHPEHYPNGIHDMNLLDVLEMLCDWKAATLRHADGDIRRSIEQNQKRFGYSDEFKQILLNTLPLIESV